MQSRIQLELNRELQGSELEVLVTSRGREPRAARRAGPPAIDWCTSKRRPNRARARLEPGSLARVRIERALPHSLVGELVSVEAANRVVAASTERYHGLGPGSPFEGAAP